MKRQHTLLLIGIVVALVFVNIALGATKTLYVDEGDFVTIMPSVIDPDGDIISYTFSSPFDNDGEWQTGFDDAGEYDILITADDGNSVTQERIILIVRDVNEAPYVTKSDLIVVEGQEISLSELVVDPNGDVLLFDFTGPFDDKGVWTPGYDDAGSIVAVFMIDDGEITTQERVSITILDANAPPIITDVFEESDEIIVREGDTLEFFVSAQDDGGAKNVEYQWVLDSTTIAEQNSGEFYFGYDLLREHVLKVIVTDGTSLVEQTWDLLVEDTNREPVIDLAEVVVSEGELISLDLPLADEDGDVLEYEFEELFDNTGEWQTGYDDEGEYEVEFTVSDGEFTVESTMDITILNVNRAPQIEAPEQLEVFEGKEERWNISVLDPDSDSLDVRVLEGYEGAFVNEEELVWEPSFDLIRRTGSFLSNVLNMLHVEHAILSTQTFPLTIQACDEELCSTKKVNALVHNVNRKPIVSVSENVTGVETQEISLDVTALDPDTDYVYVEYSEPFHPLDGTWTPGYEDAGNHTVVIRASDGHSDFTQNVTVVVNQKNRMPELKIKDDDVIVNEGHLFQINVDATDPDGDELTLWTDSLPLGASFSDAKFRWEAPFSFVQGKTDSLLSGFVSESTFLNKRLNRNQNVVWLTVIVSDGEFEVVHPVKITVKNINQAPEFVDSLPESLQTVRVGEPVLFHAVGNDPDGDTLEYEWSFGNLREGTVQGTDTIERTFVEPGEKKVHVKISDGHEEIVKEWRVVVQDAPAREPLAAPIKPGEIKLYVVEH